MPGSEAASFLQVSRVSACLPMGAYAARLSHVAWISATRAGRRLLADLETPANSRTSPRSTQPPKRAVNTHRGTAMYFKAERMEALWRHKTYRSRPIASKLNTSDGNETIIPGLTMSERLWLGSSVWLRG